MRRQWRWQSHPRRLQQPGNPTQPSLHRYDAAGPTQQSSALLCISACQQQERQHWQALNNRRKRRWRGRMRHASLALLAGATCCPRYRCDTRHWLQRSSKSCC
jgi:hypothetical protein